MQLVRFLGEFAILQLQKLCSHNMLGAEKRHINALGKA